MPLQPECKGYFLSRPYFGLYAGCGLRYGDNTEELAGQGLSVTAFDVSPAAVGKCRTRFPHTAVQYEVADLLHPPAGWARASDLVLEISTLQVLPPEPRAVALANVAKFVAAGGTLLVVARGREDDEPRARCPGRSRERRWIGLGAWV